MRDVLLCSSKRLFCCMQVEPGRNGLILPIRPFRRPALAWNPGKSSWTRPVGRKGGVWVCFWIRGGMRSIRRRTLALFIARHHDILAIDLYLFLITHTKGVVVAKRERRILHRPGGLRSIFFSRRKLKFSGLYHKNRKKM